MAPRVTHLRDEGYYSNFQANSVHHCELDFKCSIKIVFDCRGCGVLGHSVFWVSQKLSRRFMTHALAVLFS